MRPVVFAVATLVAGAAQAGGRPYAFTQGVDTLPADSLELESWFGAETAPAGGGTTWEWWLGPVVGLTDRLECGLFAVFEQPPAGAIALDELRLQVSYSLADKGTWPVDVRVRAEYGQPTTTNGPHTVWLLAIASRDFGIVNLTANAGIWVAADLHLGATTDNWWFGDYALGVSLAVVRGLRVGGEIFGDFHFATTSHDHFAGPAVAYGQGRFWLSGAVGFGLTQQSDDRYGRLVLGLAF